MINETREAPELTSSSIQHYIFLQGTGQTPFLQVFPFIPGFSIQNQIEILHYQNLIPTVFPPQLSCTSQPVRHQQLCTASPQKPLKLKKVIRRIDESDVDQFKVKMTKSAQGPQVFYKKKNTQSNLVNQAFSFLSSQKSIKLTNTYFKSKDKVAEYYHFMKKLKKETKKYINRFYLKRLLAFETKTEFQRAFIKSKLTLLTKQTIKTAVRCLLFNFFKENANLTILTSCKIFRETVPEHLWRKREVFRFLFEQLTPSQP